MTLDALREAHRRQPFLPFMLHLADGRKVDVPHPEVMFLPPGSPRTLVVGTKTGGIRLIDVLLIVELEVNSAKRRKRRAG